jgi:hypothetical protein
MARKLPGALYTLYKRLVVLRDSKSEDNFFEIEVKEQPEYATSYGFDKLHVLLSVHRDKHSPNIKKYADLLPEKSIPTLKLFFAYSAEYDLVAVTLESKSTFLTEDIFSRLVDEDVGSKMFIEPSNSFKTKLIFRK